MRTERQLAITPFLIGAGLGATAMCLLDPTTGRRRRAILQDKSRHYSKTAITEVGKATRDARNRLTGAGHRAVGRLRRKTVPDEVLEQRVRSMLGRFVSQPRAIDVDVLDGFVQLSGSVAEGEAQTIVRRARLIPGVRWVDSQLESRAASARERRRFRSRLEDSTAARSPGEHNGGGRSWNPRTRAAGALAGAAAISAAALLARGLTSRQAELQ